MKRNSRGSEDHRWLRSSVLASWLTSTLALGAVAQEPVPVPAPAEQRGDEAIAESAKKLEELVAKAEKLVERGDMAAAREACQAALRFAETKWDQPGWLAAADKVLWRLGFAAYSAGDVVTERDAWQAVHRHREATLPDEHPDVQAARVNLAATISVLGDLVGARALQEQVLAVRTKTLPAEHPDLQTARANLAGTMFHLGALADARALQEQVLAVRTKTLPAEHSDLQRARGDLANTMRELGDLAGARALQEQVLAVYTKTLPVEHPDLQRARLSLAITIRQLGDLARARALFEQVLAVRTKTLPDTHPDLQVARLNLANTMHQLGDLTGARALREQVLAVYTKSLPAEHPYLQTARLSLATTMKALGDLAGARALQEQVLAVYTKSLPDDHPNLLLARGNLANTMKALGDLAGARALQERVLAVRTKTLPDDHPDLQLARGNLASTMKALGDLAGARALQEQVLVVYTKILPEEHPDLQRTRGNLANTIRELGDLAGARALQERVLAVRTKTLPDDHPDLQSARSSLANTMRVIGDPTGARALQEQVLAVYTKTLPVEHPDLQRARHNLAITRRVIGDLAGARALQEQVLAVWIKTLPAEHPDLQRARGNLANTMCQLGDLTGARALQEQVLAVCSKTLPEEHSGLQTARGNLANTLRRLGDLAGARGLEEGVLAAYTKTLPDEHPDLQQTRRNLALTIGALGDLRAAAQLYRLVVTAALRRLASQPVAMRAAAQLASSVATSISYLNSLLDLGDQLPTELATDLRRDALHLLEATRSAELHAARLRHVVQAAHPETFARLAPQITAASQDLENAIALPPEGHTMRNGKTIARDDAIRDATFARDTLERELLELIPEELRRASSPADLAASLAPHEAAVSFVTYTRSTNDPEKPWITHSEERFGAYVLTRDNTITWYSLAPVADIETLIAAIRSDAHAGQQLAARSPTASADAVPGRDPEESTPKQTTLTKNLTELRTRLFDPILQALPEGTKSLTLSLASDLHLVPLDELPLSSGKSLSEAFDLRSVWSLRALLETRAARPALPTALVLGGPDYDAQPEDAAPVVPDAATPIVAVTADATRSDADGHAFAPLPGARAEAVKLAATFAAAFTDRSATFQLGAEASEAWFVEEARGKTFLHLATHGYFAPEQSWAATDQEEASPLAHFDTGRENRGAHLSPYSLAGLAFAGANLPADAVGRREGILTAQEVVHLDLEACELATLSACKTSLGVRRAGAGLASLRQAFHAAGARYVLATLWEVSDVEAQKLMSDFYDHLWKKGQDARVALKAAKAAARLRGVAFRDWAGWTLSGR